MTALRGFLQSIGKSESSPVGEEMSADHVASVKRHLQETELSERSKSDRRSLLNAWRVSFELMNVTAEMGSRGRERRSADTQAAAHTPFETGLRAALKKASLSPKRAAIIAGVSTSALGRWTRGALPNLRSLSSLEKLEQTLMVPDGHLVELLKTSHYNCEPVHRNEYRESLKSRYSIKYVVKPDMLSEQFKSSWERLMQHKCSLRSDGKLRRNGGHWSVTGSAASPGAIPGITTYNGSHFASAGILWNHLSAFVGYLQLPSEKGGWGLGSQEVQSLAWLVIPEALNRYLDFQTERSGGLRHTGHAVFCTCVASLTHPEHGFLSQSPELLAQLPASVVRGRTWSDLCAAARADASRWKSTCVDVSRDPLLPIQYLLDQSNPLAPIFSAMQRLRELGNNAPAGSLEEAIARRNELLLGLITSNPLRRKNLIDLTLCNDNSGSVYQTNAGEWRIRLPGAAFKNGKRRSQRARPYDVRIASWLHPLISDYKRSFRPALVTPSSPDNLFLSRYGKPLNDMTHVLLELTGRLIPGSGGFGCHAFRHLVATDWLRRNPEDFLTVAELLNDTLEVVMSTYAHLKKDDALSRHANQLVDSLPAYLRGMKPT